jgi:hypothetical protein
MQIFNVPLQNTHKFRFQSAWLSLVCHKAFAGRIIVEFWALAWAQVVIFIALACHVADSQPQATPPPPSFALPKDVLPQGGGAPLRWLESGFCFFE